MIVVDTSSIVAIFKQEEDAQVHAAIIARAEGPLISAASLLELSIVLRGLRRVPAETAEGWIDDFVSAAGFQVEAVTPEQVQVARMAHRRYGKGAGHPAALNFGDCFSYALARTRALPLLFKGNDFARTDIARVAP